LKLGHALLAEIALKHVGVFLVHHPVDKIQKHNFLENNGILVSD
jgi:hypothetical protein